MKNAYCAQTVTVILEQTVRTSALLRHTKTWHSYSGVVFQHLRFELDLLVSAIHVKPALLCYLHMWYKAQFILDTPYCLYSWCFSNQLPYNGSFLVILKKKSSFIGELFSLETLENWFNLSWPLYKERG